MSNSGKRDDGHGAFARRKLRQDRSFGATRRQCRLRDLDACSLGLAAVIQNAGRLARKFLRLVTRGYIGRRMRPMIANPVQEYRGHEAGGERGHDCENDRWRHNHLL